MPRVFQPIACLSCQSVFTPTSPGQKCCSKACTWLHRMGEQTCSQCGKQFVPTRYHQTLCSAVCRGKLYSGENNNKFKRGWYVTVQGYREINVEGERYLEHRYVMETHLGRKLATDEQVHHRDGDKLNNAFENLQLVSPSQHQLLHYTKFRDETSKQCCRCCEVKLRVEFDKSTRSGRDPHAPFCKACNAARKIRPVSV